MGDLPQNALSLLNQISAKHNGAQILEHQDITGLIELMVSKETGEIFPASTKEIRKFTQEQISYFCVKYGLYQIPTLELIEFFKTEIGSDSAIEIGAGNGCIARTLCIPATDSMIQNNPELKAIYQSGGQPTVQYGKNVLKYEGLEAVRHFKPDVVIATWVTQKYKPEMERLPVIQAFTYGVDETEMIKHVKKYVIAGNEYSHGLKDILSSRPQNSIRVIKNVDWLITRSIQSEANVIYIFKGDKK